MHKKAASFLVDSKLTSLALSGERLCSTLVVCAKISLLSRFLYFIHFLFPFLKICIRVKGSLHYGDSNGLRFTRVFSLLNLRHAEVSARRDTQRSCLAKNYLQSKTYKDVYPCFALRALCMCSCGFLAYYTRGLWRRRCLIGGAVLWQTPPHLGGAPVAQAWLGAGMAWSRHRAGLRPLVLDLDIARKVTTREEL